MEKSKREEAVVCCDSRRRLAGKQLLLVGKALQVQSLQVLPGAGRSTASCQDDVRSPHGDVAGPPQEALQGGVGQEVLEGESGYRRFLHAACFD